MQGITKITNCLAKQYQAVATIYNEHIAIGKSTMDEHIYTANDIKRWVDNFNERERLYVFQKENKVIGWGIIKRYSDRFGYRFAGETAVFFTNSETQKGYGSELKRFLLKKCKELGYHHLVAKIFSTNEASITYNQRLGYKIVGHQKEIGFKNGHWQDVTIMQYVFD